MWKVSVMAERFKEVNGLLLPTRFPEKVGLGCWHCDDHVLISYSTTVLGTSNPQIAAFVYRHGACGRLQTIEIMNGQTIVTGELRPESS